MVVHQFHRKQIIRKNRAEVFSFFENPSNLAFITPPKLGFKILTPTPIPMADGTVIDYTVRVAGLPVRWTSVINDYQPGQKFVDVQIRGPYAFWHHTHLFHEHPSGTEVEDIVRFSLPMGFLGNMIQRFLVRPQLNAIFDYREKVLDKYFHGDRIRT
jgi:ligand-binding SRPBCC domain-containing protein